MSPVITPENFVVPGGPAKMVFNPGMAMYKGKTVLMLSVLPRTRPYAENYVAMSDDGVHFEVAPKPCFTVDPSAPFGEFDMHPIDCRVTQIGDEYYIARPGSSTAHGTMTMLYKTNDFETFEFIDLIAPPNNRVPCLFPEKIGGYYHRLDRPYSIGGGSPAGEIWISRSPDLLHWGHFRFLQKGFTNWCWDKVGPCVPIKTERGWLELFHGVAGTCSMVSYSIGAMLLDLENPERILGRMTDYILTAEEDYEFMGRTPGCVFATGALADLKTRRLRCYYGAADSCIGLAEGDLDEIIDACLREPVEKRQAAMEASDGNGEKSPRQSPRRATPTRLTVGAAT